MNDGQINLPRLNGCNLQMVECNLAEVSCVVPQGMRRNAAARARC